MRRTVSSLTTISVLSLVGLRTGDASAVIVGPDTFGYRAVDQANGAVYNYIDISAGLGAVLLASQDDTFAAPTVLGAAFSYYGEVLPSLRASSNGFLTNTGTSEDFSNDCPAPINATGGGLHIAPLHDDLVTSVYYAYFDQAEAAGFGYPGETAGISVFQWEGRYFNDVNSTVDFETILFHDDGTILNLVAVASQGGLSSTSGIQSAVGNFSVLYTCNTAASIVGGTTAVRYTPPPIVSINEIRIDQTVNDDDEYFEIAGPPGASLDGLTYIVIGDGAGGTASGSVEAVVPLTGQTIPADGYFVAAEATFTIGTADLTANLNFENSDSNTHMLLRTFTGVVNADLDAGNDGVLDSTPWFAIQDALSTIDPGDVDAIYGPPGLCAAGPFCNQITTEAVGPADFGHLFRCGDLTGSWNEGLYDELAVPPSDSPGDPNNCACGDGITINTEICDTAGVATAMCDVDCTAPVCGDNLANLAAMEQCDTAGNSMTCDGDCTLPVCGDGTFNDQAELCDDGAATATCDVDCTAPVCGDGLTNMAASETCDDSGESAMCDDDCTAPSCGDGNVNEAAGETCDDTGESAMCDDDCTAIACGDDNVNEMAGETCDDGGRSATCNGDCTAASCGDGIFNATAGEECDGDGNGAPGETATCDTDCTNAVCGDMILNTTAGETCDAGDEADDCDDDCTAPSCGDDNLNEAAGEECDDGNTDDDDGCASDCLIEIGPGTSSGGESSSEGGESSEGESTTDDPTNGTDDTSATDPDSSGTDPDTSGSEATDPDTDSDTNDEDSDSDDDSSSGGSGNITPDDDGCGCNTTDERDLMASLLAFFGLGALRRRRRSA